MNEPPLPGGRPADGPDDAGSDRTASHTAFGVAALRAAHLLVDDPPPILDDPIAIRLLGPAAAERILASRDELQRPGRRALRSHLVLRSRHAEDRLHDAVARGIDQYVLLGAGFDTFAYRQPVWAAGLRIFEVDHPASQGAKLERLAAAAIERPANVRFVAADLELDPALDRLTAAGFDFARPAFVAALGLFPYLRPEAVEAVVRSLAGLAPGTELVATFARPPVTGFDGAAERAAAIGEPWLARYEPDDFEALLRRTGFGRVSFLQPDDAGRLYYAGRTDGLPPPRSVNTAIAIV